MSTHRLRRPMLAAMLLAASFVGGAPALARAAEADATLTNTIRALDARIFEAYNQCDMVAFKSYFAADVEFYHDTGGATFDRKTLVDNTRRNICNKIRRELLTETLKVYPIKGYGAVEEGEHRFCRLETGACEGIAKFVMIWRNRKGNWQLTRVVSYGHRALSELQHSP